MKVIISESQYYSIHLYETQHYPKFLEPISIKMINNIEGIMDNMLIDGSYEYNGFIKLNCRYCDDIEVHLTIDYNADINDKKEYRASYYCYDDKVNEMGKLISPEINLRIPCKDNKYDTVLLSGVISHELTHLYDDWIRINNGLSSGTRKELNVDTTNLLVDNITDEGTLNQCISMFLYLLLDSEKKAFLTQTFVELKKYKCTQDNYKDVIKKTLLYNNINKTYKIFKANIDNVEPRKVKEIITMMKRKYSSIKIPNNLNSSDYDYIEKLKAFFSVNYKRLMQKFYSLVSYYISNL